MDVFGGPAALGGIIVCVALGAWMLGRLQGGVAPAADRESGAAPVAASRPQVRFDQAHDGADLAIPCQQAAQAQRRGAPDTAYALGDLHAEISAYRRAEQVLAGLGREQLDLMLVASHAGQDCRYIGVSGKPACPMPATVRHGSACDTSCLAFRPLRLNAVQPSPVVSDFTRV